MIATRCEFPSWSNWKTDLLVLARRINQSIMIGDDVELVVVDIKGDQVKLGIKAPRNVSVHRSEVHQEIQEQNKKAAAASPESLKSVKDLLKKPKPGKK